MSSTLAEEKRSCIPGGPDGYEKTVCLRDGTRVVLRPIGPEDGELLLELFNSLSKETIRLRFFSLMKHMPRDLLEKFTHIDYNKQMAIVAVVDEGGRERIVAVGRYNVLPGEPDKAEFAIVVQDAYQRRGIGMEALRQIIHVAGLNGVRVIVGYIMHGNYRMFALLRKSGLNISKRILEDGILQVDIPIPEHVGS